MAPKKKDEPEEEEEADPGPPPIEDGEGLYIFPDSSKYGECHSCPLQFVDTAIFRGSVAERRRTRGTRAAAR